jgi:hypothetical protein
MSQDSSIRDREFIGQGLAYPLQLTARGELALAHGDVEIEQSIRIILETVPGERKMRPEFGCRVHTLIFHPRDASTEALLIEYVREALARWEPRIDLENIEVLDSPENDGAWFVNISYIVKATHDTRSIVFPFYLEGEEGAPPP